MGTKMKIYNQPIVGKDLKKALGIKSIFIDEFVSKVSKPSGKWKKLEFEPNWIEFKREV